MTVAHRGLPLGTLRERQRRAARAGRLDCAFCGLGYEDFNSLAYHVAHACRFAPESVINQREQEQRMKPKDRPKKDRSIPSGSVPPAGDAPDRGDRRAFLRVNDIPTGGAVVTFNGESRVVKGSYGDQWICGVRVGGKEYDWGIRIGGSVHRAVEAKTGRKLKRGLKVNVEPREFENYRGELIKFIAVSDED